jgi:protoporphyrinogen oxidase
MEIGIIGAGITGIGAAWQLAKRGHRVTLYEKESAIGGLARAMPLDGRFVERYYHFIMAADTHLHDLIREMGLADRLNWVETETQFYARGRMYPFTSPLHLLTFGAIGPLDRLRFIATMLYLTKFAGSWKKMEDRLAREFLPRWGGRRTWEIVFRPMLDMKFGELTGEMSMAWMWARTRMVKQYREKGVARERRAWIKGSLKALLDAVDAWFTKNGVVVIRNEPVGRILIENGKAVGVCESSGEARRFDKVLFCAPSPELKRLLPEALGPYFDRIHNQRYFAVTCVVMALSEPLSDHFWTYVSDARVPFVGVVDYATFTRHDGASGQNVIYIPHYSLADSPPFTTDDDRILDASTRGLKVVFPHFNEKQVRDVRVVRDPHASIVCTGRYSERIPGIRTPISNLYFANLSQIYPQDRGLSVGLKLAEYAVTAMFEDRDVEMDFAPY